VKQVDKKNLYKILFEKHPHPLIVYNQKTLKILAVNDAAEKFYGYNEEEFVNLTIKDIRPPEEIPDLLEYLKSRNLFRKKYTIWYHCKKDGSVVPVEISSSEIEFENIPSRLVSVTDISRRLESEKALKKEELNYKSLVENINEGIVQADNDDVIQFVNKRYCELLGYSKDELIGKVGYEVLLDQDGQELIKKKNQDRIKGVTDKYEIKMKKKDGTPIYMEVSGTPIYDINGKVIGSLGVHSDVTERRKNEEQLRRLASFPEQNPNIVIELDLTGNIKFMNQSAKITFPDLKEKSISHPALFKFQKIINNLKISPIQSFSREVKVYEKYFRQKFFYLPDNNLIRIFSFDITEIKKAKESIEESEEKFRSLVEHSLVGVYLIQDNIFRYINPKLAEIFGYAIKEIVDKLGPKNIIPAEDWLIVGENLRKRISGEVESVSYSFSGLKKSGELIKVEVYGSRTVYQGRPAVIGTLIDITEREMVENEIRDKERNYRNLINSSMDAIYVLKDKKLVLVNPSWEKLFGISAKEATSDNFDVMSIVAEESKKYIEQRFISIDLNDFERSKYEMKAITRQGIRRDLEVSVSKIIWQGEVAVQGIYRDITDRKRAVEILKKSEGKYRDLFELAPVGIYQSTRDGGIITANIQLAKILGYSSIEELMELNIKDLYPDKNLRQKLISEFEPIGSIANLEIQWIKKDGEKVWINLDAHVIRDVANKEIYFEGFVRDIDFRKKAEFELLNAKEKAEEANRLKSAFLSTVSHEIRSPLNAILGFNSILKEIYYKNAADDEKQFFNSMEEAGTRLLDTITQVLDISRLEADDFSLNVKPLSVNNAIKSAYNLLIIQAEKKNLNIRLDLPDKEIVIDSDEYCFGGVLVNLISNALKYSNKGEITVKLKEITDSIICSVQDQGIGMSDEYKKHLFETFSQEDVGLSRRYEGAGLGLAITKRYIDLLGGTIQVESKKNVGTTMTVKIPKINPTFLS